MKKLKSIFILFRNGFLDVDTSNFSEDSPSMSPQKIGIKNDPFINW